MDHPYKKFKRVLDLDSKFFQNMGVWRIFKDSYTQVNSMDFTKAGDFLIVADDYSLSLYDCTYGYKLSTVKNLVQKIAIVKFIEGSEKVLIASNDPSPEVHHWDLPSNQILGIFRGHTDDITSLEVPRGKRYFITCSKDRTFRLWSTAGKGRALAVFDLSDLTSKSPCVTFEPAG